MERVNNRTPAKLAQQRRRVRTSQARVPGRGIAAARAPHPRPPRQSPWTAAAGGARAAEAPQATLLRRRQTSRRRHQLFRPAPLRRRPPTRAAPRAPPLPCAASLRSWTPSAAWVAGGPPRRGAVQPPQLLPWRALAAHARAPPPAQSGPCSWRKAGAAAAGCWPRVPEPPPRHAAAPPPCPAPRPPSTAPHRCPACTCPAAPPARRKARRGQRWRTQRQR